MDEILEALQDVDTDGLQNLVKNFFEWLINFDIKVDTASMTDFTAKLLDTFHGVWNPIWEIVNQWLSDLYGF